MSQNRPPTRPIDRRFRPPVGGIDLVQATNYLRVADVGASFIYDHYTSSCLPYRRGHEPELEAVVQRSTASLSEPLGRVQALAHFVAENVLWAGHFAKKTGRQLAKDRGISEREILQSGFGWCMEQARLLCGLTQIDGFPSRLVFACDRQQRYGHVITEVLLPAGWLAVDQSFGYCFCRNGQPVPAVMIYNDPKHRAEFQPVYRQFCQRLRADLGDEILNRDFSMVLAEDPLDGFEDLGYHNHYIV